MATVLEMAAPSPASDESSTEGPALQEFAHNTTIPERQQAVSPRSAIFSHTSLRTAPMAGRSDIIPDTKVVVAAKPSRRNRDNSGTGSRRKHERDLTHTSASSQRELVKLLIDQEHETSNLRHALATAVQRVQAEALRVAALEREKQEVVQRSRIIDESRQQAQQEASKAAQELRVYTLQLENAQKEIERAQNDARELQRQRDEAEAEAARAKAKARKLHEQTMISAAREEGRQLGFQAGFDQARRERLAVEARKKKAIAQKPPVPRIEETPPVQQPRYIAKPPPRIRTEENDEGYNDDDDDEGSVSRLPLRGFPPMHQDPGPSRRTREEPQHRRHPRSPTEDDYISERDDPRFPPRQQQMHSQDPRGHPQPAGRPSRQGHPPDRAPSPQIQVYSIDIPPQEQIEREFNSREDPNEVLSRRPREEWVTAQKHREFRQPSQHAPHFPGRHPPPLRVPPQQRPPLQQANKSVSFLSRGSLKKTKDQAMSWYRSLSRRKNNKPSIDPVPEESPAAVAAASASPAGPPTFPIPQNGPVFPVPETVPAPAEAHGVTPSAARSAVSVRSRASQMQMPVAAPASVRAPSQQEESHYGGGGSQTASSWYPPKTAPSVVASMRSRDPSGRRPPSVASTSVSQFALLATPHPGSLGPWMNDDSMREPSQRGGVREKESLLSVIKEDNMSRGHTPSSDRFFPPGAGTTSGGQPAPGMPQPSFGFPHPQFLQHQQSQATMDNRSVRRSNKPPSIMVPDPDAPLDPAGVAYMRAQPDVFGGNGSGLGRQPSRSSQVTPGSIKIDVVPPSGVPHSTGQSPPHTGRNHLSPYHTIFKPPINGISLAPAQSMMSMRSQKSGRAQPEYDDGVDAMSRRQSKQSMNTIANNQPSRPPSSLGGAFARVAAPFMQHIESATGKSPARSTRLGLHKPESIASFTSRKTGRGPFSMHTQTPRVAPAPVAQEQTPMLMAPQQMRRSGSNSSLRSNTSYSRFQREGYVDPAYWGVDGPSDPSGGLLTAGPDPNGRRSASSDLSYA